MKPIILIVAILAVTSLLLVPIVTVYADTSLPMTGSQWSILELLGSKIKTTHATTISTGGVEFLFPVATATPPGYANLMTNGFTASLTTIDTLTAVIQVFTSTSTTMFVGNPNGHCSAASPNYCPGAVRLYFTSNLPQAGMSSCLGLNGNSQHSVVANWSDLCGHYGTMDPAAFMASISNIKNLGVSFGSGFFFENGVGVDGTTGTATFQLTSYTIS